MPLKHTPGPWKYAVVTEASLDKGYGYVWQASNGVTIAEIRKGVAVESDARLISAAPDLLAALQETIAALTESGDLTLLPDSVFPAIRKATGE